MNYLKFILGFFLSLLVSLIMMVSLFKEKEESLFKSTVQLLMIEENLSSYEEVKEYFPELKIIESKIEEIQYIERNIHSLVAGPAPRVSKEDNIRLQEYIYKIANLRTTVKAELLQLRYSHPSKQTRSFSIVNLRRYE